MNTYTTILSELYAAEVIGTMKALHNVLVKIVPSIWGWDEYISNELEKIDIYDKESFYGPIRSMEWDQKIRWYIKYCNPEIHENRKVYSRYNHAIGYIENDQYVAQCPMEFIYEKLKL